MKKIINAIILLLLALILQIVIFRFAIFASGWAIIFFHLYGLTMLPIGWNKTSYLFVGAITGIVLDLCMLTGGLHMAAGTFLGLALPHISSLVAPREGFHKGHIIIGFKDVSFCIQTNWIFKINIFDFFVWFMIKNIFKDQDAG